MKQQHFLIFVLSLSLVLSGGLQAAVKTDIQKNIKLDVLQAGSINGLNYS